MNIIKKSKITKILNFNLKLIVLSSLLFSQLSLSEIFLYQNNPGTSSINIAKANTSDTWYNTSYLYRKEITIAGSSADLTNYQIKQTIAWVSGKMNADFSDLRFVGADGLTVYNYYIESKTDSVTANVWIKVNSIPTAGTYIYMYYGNSGAGSLSSGDNTFDFFDHFDGSGVDTNKWEITGTVTETNSQATIGSSSDIHSYQSFGYNMEFVQRSHFAGGTFFALDDSFSYMRMDSMSDNSYSELVFVKSGNLFSYYTGETGGDHVWKIQRIGTDLLKFYKDSSVFSTYAETAAISTNNLRIKMRAPNQVIDYVYARKFVSSEPALSLGTEEGYATAYNLIAPFPSSGLASTPSQNFTVTPAGIYTGTITITPSGGGLFAVITKTFTNSSIPQTFTITPTVAGTITLTLTNSGGFTNPSPVTYTSIAISASPSNFIQSSANNTIDITGIGTSWIAGTPGSPTFTLSGGTGASITDQTVIDPTHATLTINAGSTAGNLTVTDPSIGATTIVSVVPSTSNLITSFNIAAPAAIGAINDTAYTVSFTVPYGTNVTSLTPTITVSIGATISPTSGTSHNFTSPATYAVIAQDGTTTQNYTVTVNISPSTAGGFIPPTQPIIPIQDNRIDISNLPPDIIQIATSRTPDFKDVSWEVFSNEVIKQLDNCPDKLYIKFRNKSGAVSDVIIYIPKTSSDINLSNLKDGDIVKTIDNPDVYIIKLKNNKQYKRLILSPQVFQSYGHLKWSNLKIISQEELNQYLTSDLVKETADTIIYELFSNEDTGERREFDTSKTYDADSVYEINQSDRDSYKLVK